jgi:hypothetical protein
MMMSQIVVKIEEDEEEGAIELLNAVNGILIETRTRGGRDIGGPRKEFDTVRAILIGGGALAIAKFITEGWDRRKGGVVVDLRPGAEAEIRRSKDVPFGWILIFPRNDGAVRIEVKDEPKDWVERILEKIIGGTLGTVRDIAATAKERLKGNQVTDTNGTPVPLADSIYAYSGCHFYRGGPGT